MMNNVAVPAKLFSYANMSPEELDRITSARNRITVRCRRMAEDILEVGNDLEAIQEDLNWNDFKIWSKLELGLSENTLKSFISLANRYGSESEEMIRINPLLIFAVIESFKRSFPADDGDNG